MILSNSLLFGNLGGTFGSYCLYCHLILFNATLFLKHYKLLYKHFSAQTTLWNTSSIVSDYVFILFLINKNMWTHLHRQGMYELVCLLWNLLARREVKSLTQTSCSAWGRLNKEVMRGQRAKKNPTKIGSVDDHSRCEGVCLHWTHQRYPSLSELSIWCCLNTGTLSWLLICGVSFLFVHGTSLSFGWKPERDYWQVRTRFKDQSKRFANSTSIWKKCLASSDH